MTSENDVFGGHLTLPKYKIVECGVFCEVIFLYISPKNLLGAFSPASTTRLTRREPDGAKDVDLRPHSTRRPVPGQVEGLVMFRFI